MESGGIFINSSAYLITTERLHIRCYDPKDAYLLKETIDNNLSHLRVWLEWAHNEPEDIEKKIERIKMNRVNFDLNSKFVYGIFTPDNSKLIGSIALMNRIGDNALEIGYWISKDYLDQGIATEATTALVRVAFDIIDIERVEIHCDPQNIKSAAIPRKLGFTHEGTIRENDKNSEGKRKESMIWVIFKDEYEKTDLKQFNIKAFDIIDRQIL